MLQFNKNGGYHIITTYILCAPLISSQPRLDVSSIQSKYYGENPLGECLLQCRIAKIYWELTRDVIRL